MTLSDVARQADFTIATSSIGVRIMEELTVPVALDAAPQEVVRDQSDIQPQISTASTAVYLDYDVPDPPPVPASNWTRFVCISDTHAHEFPVPAGDVLLHAGDLTHTGRVREFRTTFEWLRSLPHPVKMYATFHLLWLTIVEIVLIRTFAPNLQHAKYYRG